MTPAPDLASLPPLPTVPSVVPEDGDGEPMLLEDLAPIPAKAPVKKTTLRSESKRLPASLPVVKPAGLSSDSKTPTRTATTSPPRHIDSPFKVVDRPPEPQRKATPLPPTSLSPEQVTPPLRPKPIPKTKEEPSSIIPKNIPAPQAMQQPETLHPPEIDTSKVKTLRHSITGPVSIRKEAPPVAPPEVMLRSTVRRTLSEQNTGGSPFKPVSGWERFRWTLKALLTSQSFDDIAFEKTRRFRIDEVYLLRQESLTLISYASNDPVRHVYPRKVDYDLRRLRAEVQQAISNELDAFELPAKRRALVRHGKYSHLIAVMRGEKSESIVEDLDFSLHRIEYQVGKRLADEVSNFTFPLQPMLEDCLLIQSAAAPA